ncbi:DNA/RNA non-specific endonuclease [Luteolibacter sp. Populi]|uniref:DNA/RNA non-specific endonuclease n=1 Tax=Luteolibacter sp. Populi TaxID=3230487 RepID=UPI0034656F3B
MEVVPEGNIAADGQQTANDEIENGGEDRVEDTPDGGKVITTPGGYRFFLDKLGRTIRVMAKLKSNRNQKRSKKEQLEAGGEYRLSSDEGGHILARIFNGPLGKYNHFAQDRNLNRGKYRTLEKQLDILLQTEQDVETEIKVFYRGKSLRPSRLRIKVSIDGRKPMIVEFANRKYGI